MDYENVPDTSARKRKLCRLVVLSFGLLFILQVILSISLRLALYESTKNETKEEESLRRKLNMFDLNTQQGWVYFRGSFYYISYIKKSWSDSREDCLQRGADLVIISSIEEQNFIRLFRRNTWIGLSDTEEEGTWKWVDGTLLNSSFRYWRTGEPNSLRDEDCGVMVANDEENCWNDANCRDENFWICEKMVDQ
ncbi:C-type lectin domain family 4 member M-like [Oreochromis niloticus]|uniref:C-type lectin domain family 4 member M-like n=1 Tax=Oreochromis niloticus TaxID=8128 RepID=UPI000DF249A5|nr:C-type lectin domain family 4 member M-like [Oreochromis niloticus]